MRGCAVRGWSYLCVGLRRVALVLPYWAHGHLRQRLRVPAPAEQEAVENECGIGATLSHDHALHVFDMLAGNWRWSADQNCSEVRLKHYSFLELSRYNGALCW